MLYQPPNISKESGAARSRVVVSTIEHRAGFPKPEYGERRG
jgi:hypothetical protein